jgi:2-phospho-L-lactate guanylyltransferase
VSVLPDESSAGQSAAALVGVRHAVVAGFDRALLVPGDTPIIEPHEIDLMLARAADDGTAVVIVPDRHRTGTNALVITPPDAFEPSFGPGSLDRHVSNARAAGLSHRVDPVESLLLDVDTPDDLAALAESIERHRVGAARTRGALRQLDRLAGVRLGGSSPPRPPMASAHGSGRRPP